MYKTILVPLDGSALSEAALSTASALSHKSGAQLVLVRALGSSGLPAEYQAEAQARAVREAEAYLQGIARGLTQQGLDVRVALPCLPAAKGILAEIELHHADLVVMTTHGRSGPGRWLYGSVAEAVLRGSPVPVWLVRAWGALHHEVLQRPQPRILAPLDGSAVAETALPHAIELARLLDGVVVLFHVLVPPPIHPDPRVAQVLAEAVALEDEEAGRDYLDQVAKKVTGAGVGVETVVRAGQPVQRILEETWATDIDLVVMATHGWTGLNRLLFGSVAAQVLRHGTLPLVVTRPQGLALQEEAEAVGETPALERVRD